MAKGNETVAKTITDYLERCNGVTKEDVYSAVETLVGGDRESIMMIAGYITQ